MYFIIGCLGLVLIKKFRLPPYNPQILSEKLFYYFQSRSQHSQPTLVEGGREGSYL